MPGCPHARVEFCPLYIAAHEGYEDVCVDDLALPCMVARSRDDGLYRRMVAIVARRWNDPKLFALIRFKEEAHVALELARARVAQRNRDLRLNGVH